MTLGALANKVAKYLRQSRSYFVDEGADDLIIQALNNGRIAAEREHDFFKQQAEVGLSVDPVSGGDVINDSKYMNGDSIGTTPASVKSIYRAYYQNSTNTAVWFPMLLDPKQLLSKKAVEQNYKFRGYPTRYTTFQYRDVPLSRFGGDPRNYLSTRPFRAYWQGDNIFIDPRPTSASTVKLDVQTWMTPYKDEVTVTVSSTGSSSVTIASSPPSSFVEGVSLLGKVVTGISGTTVTLSGNASLTIATSTKVSFWDENATDWMLEEGQDYLMWYAICECNMLAQTFVPRQEGYISPPEKARDVAKASMILKDDYVWENAREPLLIR